MKVFLVGEKGVRCVFDEFGRAPADIEDQRGIEIKWPVDFGEHRAGAATIAVERAMISPSCRPTPSMAE